MYANRKHQAFLTILAFHSLALLFAAQSLGESVWYIDDNCSGAGEGTLADPFCTLQQGIDAASDGDTVLVARGMYTGLGNRDISLFGKAITLTSIAGSEETVLEIQGSPSSIHRGFFLVHGETQETVIEGLTIQHGYLVGITDGLGQGGGGAGIYIRDSSPTIRNCVIRENVSATLNPPFPVDGRGAGIYVDGNSSAIIEHCIIADNSSDRRGGGMYIGYEDTNVVIRNGLVTGNSSVGTGYGGGGIYTTFGAATFINTTIAYNVSSGPAGGLKCEGSEVALKNCIVWGNEAGFGGQQAGVDQYAHLVLEYTDIPTGEISSSGEILWGPGNIDADPLFVDDLGGDFRLLGGSPCIDAGDNFAVPGNVVTDLDGLARFVDDLSTPDTGNPAFGAGIVDMGAYEFGSSDCNNNGLADARDVAGGGSLDCDANNIPDECQPDCDASGVADTCEPVGIDCDGNARLDQCDPDCNANGQPDACDLAEGSSQDCNHNLVPDECDESGLVTIDPVDQQVEMGQWVMFTAGSDLPLPVYQWRKDGQPLSDTERIVGTHFSTMFISPVLPCDAGNYDCVVTDTVTGCFNVSDPATLTVIAPCPTDLNGDGTTNAADLAQLLAAWGTDSNSAADLNCDGMIGAFDLAWLLGNWGPCE